MMTHTANGTTSAAAAATPAPHTRSLALSFAFRGLFVAKLFPYAATLTTEGTRANTTQSHTVQKQQFRRNEQRKNNNVTRNNETNPSCVSGSARLRAQNKRARSPSVLCLSTVSFLRRVQQEGCWGYDPGQPSGGRSVTAPGPRCTKNSLPKNLQRHHHSLRPFSWRGPPHRRNNKEKRLATHKFGSASPCPLCATRTARDFNCQNLLKLHNLFLTRRYDDRRHTSKSISEQTCKLQHGGRLAFETTSF